MEDIIMDRVLSCRESCIVLSISKATLYRLTNAGQLRKVRLSACRVGWRSVDLAKFVEDRIEKRWAA